MIFANGCTGYPLVKKVHGHKPCNLLYLLALWLGKSATFLPPFSLSLSLLQHFLRLVLLFTQPLLSIVKVHKSAVKLWHTLFINLRNIPPQVHPAYFSCSSIFSTFPTICFLIISLFSLLFMLVKWVVQYNKEQQPAKTRYRDILDNERNNLMVHTRLRFPRALSKSIPASALFSQLGNRSNENNERTMVTISMVHCVNNSLPSYLYAFTRSSGTNIRCTNSAERSTPILSLLCYLNQRPNL